MATVLFQFVKLTKRVWCTYSKVCGVEALAAAVVCLMSVLCITVMKGASVMASGGPRQMQRKSLLFIYMIWNLKAQMNITNCVIILSYWSLKVLLVYLCCKHKEKLTLKVNWFSAWWSSYSLLSVVFPILMSAPQCKLNVLSLSCNYTQNTPHCLVYIISPVNIRLPSNISFVWQRMIDDWWFAVVLLKLDLCHWKGNCVS